MAKPRLTEKTATAIKTLLESVGNSDIKDIKKSEYRLAMNYLENLIEWKLVEKPAKDTAPIQ